MNPRLSVVVPSYNRVQHLQRLIPWLRSQTLDKRMSEVLIVNDGSTDGTKAFLDAQTDGWIRVIHQLNQGQAKARNAGVAIAQGDVLLFLDDDMEPGSPGFFAAHLNFHDLSPKAGVAIGAILPPKEDNWRPAFEHFYEKSIGLLYESFRRGSLQPAGEHFFSANISLPKRLFLASGGFSTAFTQAEDRELGLRLEYECQSGFSFLETAFAYHHSPTGRYTAFLKRAYTYGRYDLRIAKHYPEHDKLSPYQIFAKPPLLKMIIAKSAWSMPDFVSHFNKPLIVAAVVSHRLGWHGLALKCCSILYCINFVLGLKDEHDYDL